MAAGLVMETVENRKKYLSLTEEGLQAAIVVDALEMALRSAESKN